MQEAFGIVIFAVVGISVVLAVVSLFFRGRTYDQIGRGGIGDDGMQKTPAAPSGGYVDLGERDDQIGRGGIGDDREIRPAAPSGGYVDLGERDAEIRQMLAARNARHAARGEDAVDVEAELARLTAPAVDPALREEIRELVIARNSRREAKGQPPLDVDAEIERQIRDLGG